MRTLGLFSYLCFTATHAAAGAALGQDYLRQYSETRGFMLGRPAAAKPTPDGKAVLFLRATARVPEMRLYEFDVATRQTRELITPQQILQGAAESLSPEERARRERMRVSVRGFTSFDLSQDGALILISLSGRLYTVDRHSGAVAALHTGQTPAVDPRLSPDRKLVAYVRDRDLYTLELATQKEHRLTHSVSPHVTYGLAEFVAQEEMHRFSGYFWSPDSQHLAVEEADTSPVETFHIVDPAHPEAEPQAMSYPRPGKANALVRLGMVQARGAAHGAPITWIHWDLARFPYLSTVRWQDRAPLTLVVQTRDQRDLEVLRVDQRTGQTHRLLAEHDEAWLNLDQQMPHWLEDGSGFLWTTERRGAWELELRDKDGLLLEVLANKDVAYAGFVGASQKAGQAVFTSSREPTERQLMRVALAGGPALPLTGQPGELGVHSAAFSKDFSIYVHSVSTLQGMPRTTVRSADGQELAVLESVAETSPITPQVELAQVGARGYRVALVRPRGFVPGRKYPVVVDVYGGPAHSQVMASQARWLLDQWLADHGYVVFSVDGRGTPGRGREWERAIRGNFAQITLEDQVAALQASGVRYHELDLSRVGIVGWSFGGYMAALAVMRRPDVFHVGVAGAPVTEWLDYDTFYTERYLDLPEQNQAGYTASSLLTYAKDLTRPLLIMHGTGDDNVYFFHSLKLSHALFLAGRHHEFLPLSGLTHMVPDPLVNERKWGRIVDLFQQTLKP